jgi:hypothetical protein
MLPASQLKVHAAIKQRLAWEQASVFADSFALGGTYFAHGGVFFSPVAWACR